MITAHQGEGRVEGVLLDKMSPDTIIKMGKYEFRFRHDHTLGWSPGAEGEWPVTSAVLIQTGEDEFYLSGTGVVVTCKSLKNDLLQTGILKADEGWFENKEWKILRHLNGDQTHQGRHLRIPLGEYSIQRFELYLYE